MKKVFVCSTSLSKFGKTSLSVLELSAQTARECLKDFDIKKLDLLVFATFAAERYTQELHLAAKLADTLQLPKNCFCLRVETASSSGASAFHTAVRLLQSGMYSNALVVATEVMSRLPREENNLLLGKVLSSTQQNFQMSMAQGAALITQRYLYEFGYSKDDLFWIAEKLHFNGSFNPKAHFQKKISKEDYDKAPIFAYPLGLYDISPISDGSAAVLLSTQQSSNFFVSGLGSGISTFQIIDAPLSFEASTLAFQKAYQEAKISPKEIQVAELHDAFTTFELIGAEDAGFFPRGTALRKLKEGVTSLSGSLPINPSGGLKSRGHPIAASGLAQIVELLHFMQKKEFRFGLTHSIGGLATNNFVTILEQKL